MTVVIAYEYKNKVYLGADSYCGDGNSIDICDTPKIYKINNFGVGICGNIKCELILEKTLKRVLKRKSLKITRDWIVFELSNLIKEEMIKEKILDEVNGKLSMPESAFIFAYNGEAYYLQDDFSVWRSNLGYTSIGDGALYAKAAMEVLKDLDLKPQKKVEKALEVATKFSCFVEKPFSFVEV